MAPLGYARFLALAALVPDFFPVVLADFVAAAALFFAAFVALDAVLVTFLTVLVACFVEAAAFFLPVVAVVFAAFVPAATFLVAFFVAACATFLTSVSFFSAALFVGGSTFFDSVSSARIGNSSGGFNDTLVRPFAEGLRSDLDGSHGVADLPCDSIHLLLCHGET